MTRNAAAINVHPVPSLTLAFLLSLSLFGPAPAAVKCADDGNTNAIKNGTSQYPYTTRQPSMPPLPAIR